MKGKWRRTVQYIQEEQMYAVFRMRNVDRAQHAGNMEFATSYTADKEAIELLISKLNSYNSISATTEALLEFQRFHPDIEVQTEWD